MSARHQMAGLIMTGQRFATLSNLDMQQCPKMFCNFVQKVLAKNRDTKVDNKKYKEKFGLKAKMLQPEEVMEYTGHAIGGVCPFATPDANVETYLDESMKRFETVYPAAGSSNSCVEVTMEELYKASKAKEWVDVCKFLDSVV